MKTCTKCHQPKPLVAFPPRRTMRDGRDSHCRACATAATRRWRADNPEAMRSARRRWRIADQQRRAERKRWRLAHQQRAAERNRCWRVAHQQRAAEQQQRRRLADRKRWAERKRQSMRRV
jgi:hypothetical protein